MPRYRYQQLADDLEAEITTGRLPVGGRLPGEHELREIHGVSLGTVRRAMGLLRERGLISTLTGAGSFVIRSRRPTPQNDTPPPSTSQ
ncbi:winged helix-turn-helix domain-containing protein [Streptomyces taklimakanensis]|nr:winged helix-turn-helix domain-containing protein [Streptomyces taklimakanensis]